MLLMVTKKKENMIKKKATFFSCWTMNKRTRGHVCGEWARPRTQEMPVAELQVPVD